MNIQRISVGQVQYQKVPSFKSQFVVLPLKSPNVMAKTTSVVDNFNKKILPELNKTGAKTLETILGEMAAAPVVSPVIKNLKDLQEKVNFFVLPKNYTGSSSFDRLTRIVGNDYNELNFPVPVDERIEYNDSTGKISDSSSKTSKIHLLDFMMAEGKDFIGEDGVKVLSGKAGLDSFCSVMDYYAQGNEIKDTIFSFGNAVYDGKMENVIKFFTKHINDPDKLFVTIFDEQENLAFLYLSQEFIKKYVNEICYTQYCVPPQKFEDAIDVIDNKFVNWFGVDVNGKNCMNVKTDKIQQINEIQDFYDFAEQVSNGEHLKNFDENLGANIQESFKKRIFFKNLGEKYMFLMQNRTLTPEQLVNAETIEGVKVIV